MFEVLSTMSDPDFTPTSMEQELPPPVEAPPTTRRRLLVPTIVGAVVFVLLALVFVMRWRADSLTNKEALSSSAKPATVVQAKDSHYQPSRTYVGTLEPWVEAKVGPQFISAYVDTVLVRPGAVVKKGDVLATLDCRNASAQAQAVAEEARALNATQKALADETTRLSSLLDAGFVPPNLVEQREAQTASEQAKLLAQRAKLLGTSLEVSDCILRAPFDGEIGQRWLDPGAFVHPGDALVSAVDRSTVRFTGDVPERDFDMVPPGKTVTLHVYATGADVAATVARRAPSADPATRTVHIEADIPDPTHSVPVFTTGELHVEVGEPMQATELPLVAATIRGEKASVFVVDGNVAHQRVFPYIGEIGGSVFLDKSLPPGSLVVTEGRALLNDGDKVTTKVQPGEGPAKE